MTNLPTSPMPSPSADSSATTIRVIGRMTAVLVAVLALAAFALSYEVLRDLAAGAGVMNRKVAWLFPLIIDGGIVVFSLAALRASLSGADTRWFMSLVILVTVISVGLNIAHAGKGLLPAFMAAMPPLLLFLAFESLMRQIRDTVVTPVRVRSRPKQLRKAVVLSAVADDDPSVRRSRANELLAQGLSRNKIAKQLRVAPSTVRRYLADSKVA